MKYKIHLYIVLIIYFLASIITVTYAWITVNNNIIIDNISLSGITNSQLEISLDGENFSSSLNLNELSNLINNIKLTDVTSSDGINFERGGLNSNSQVIVNQDYLSFDLWIRTTQPERYIYLVNNTNKTITYNEIGSGTFVVSKGVYWKATHTFINGPDINDVVLKEERNIYYSSDALRLSIIELKDLENEFDLREEDELRRFIYDPSENEERGYGKAYGAFSYFIAKTGLIDFSLPKETPKTQYKLTEFEDYNPYIPLDDQSLVAVLIENGKTNNNGQEFYSGKIRINIWIEGWDADAFDSILKDQIKIQLEFKAGLKPL
jgi:hypothetical protein